MNDGVAYNGSSYISIQAGTNDEPDISASYWTLLAQAGAAGATGTARRRRSTGAHRIGGRHGGGGAAGTARHDGCDRIPRPHRINGSHGSARRQRAQGAAGPAGLNWQGTWSSGTAYAVNDGVAYNGSSYISIQAGSNQEPDTSASYWTLLSRSRGDGSHRTARRRRSTRDHGIDGATGRRGRRDRKARRVRPGPKVPQD